MKPNILQGLKGKGSRTQTQNYTIGGRVCSFFHNVVIARYALVKMIGLAKFSFVFAEN